MRVALVNPNRYLEPPVIPLGIEYLAHYLDREGHEVEVIDLAFTADPEAALIAALQSLDPDVAGFSLRNVDSSLYHDNLFFLEEAAHTSWTSRARSSWRSGRVSRWQWTCWLGSPARDGKNCATSSASSGE